MENGKGPSVPGRDGNPARSYLTKMAHYHFSIVIPTYQRREVVLKAVRALEDQEFDGNFEVIVVVDGSRDGSAEALRKLKVPFPLRVIEQPNQGAATARNCGASEAQGEILFFLDDDMIAHPRLLAEHQWSHQNGADVVVGHIPLHPDSPPTILTPAVRDWADRRGQKLSSPSAQLTLHDFLTGQLSLARETFFKAGAFDTNFTLGGSFGNEDIDFGYRLLLGGYKILFNPEAISWQYYVVKPRQYLRQWYQAGMADVNFARKHPDQAQTLFKLNGSESRMNRIVWRRIVEWPFLGSCIIFMLRSMVLALIDKGVQHPYAVWLFREVKRAEYWRGVFDAGGIPSRHPLRILAYHAIADLQGVAVLEQYGVPPKMFEHQLELLLRAGFRFVSATEVIRFLQRTGGLPRRAVLLTFDDGYEDLLDIVLPILKEKRIPAVVFAVSNCLGKTNEWDLSIQAGQHRLLDADGLRKLAEVGIEIGAHSRTHPLLTSLSSEDLNKEVLGSVEELELLGLGRPRLFAYPYGDFDDRVRRIVEEAGLKGAFTIDPGLMRP